jgi:chromosome segregation ATPase
MKDYESIAREIVDSCFTDDFTSEINVEKAYKRIATALRETATENCYRINRAIEYAHEKLGIKWDSNRQRLDYYEKVSEHLGLEKPKDVLLACEQKDEKIKELKKMQGDVLHETEWQKEQIKALKERIKELEVATEETKKNTIKYCTEREEKLQSRIRELEDVLNRLDIECKGTTCDCGSELKDWDIAILVKQALAKSRQSDEELK